MSTNEKEIQESADLSVDSKKRETTPSVGNEEVAAPGNAGTKCIEERSSAEGDQVTPKRNNNKKKEKNKETVAVTQDADVLQPGVIISPAPIQEKCSSDKKAMGARPKSGPVTKDQPNTKVEQPKGGRQGSQTKSGGKPGSGSQAMSDGKSGSGSQGRSDGRPGSGSKNRNKGNRPTSGTPNRGARDAADNDNQRGPNRNTSRGQGKNVTPEQENSRDERQKGRGRNTPRSQQNRNNQKTCFEPYLSQEELQRGLKLGELIQGPLRINPRNYEEGYLPHPDGVSDIFICGMKDRNRACNGDIVAVRMYDKKDWKIHIDNLKNLEEKHAENDIIEMQSDIIARSEETEGQGDSDSEPDVIIESEEIIDLTGDGNSNSDAQSSTSLSVSADKNFNQSESQMLSSASGPSICDNDNKLKESVSSQSVKDITKNLSNVSIDSNSNGVKPETPKSDHRKRQLKDGNKGRNTPGSAQKKYSTLQEVLKEGSNVVKNLFTTEDTEKAKCANRVLQRTGKIVAIIEAKHARACTGHINLMNDKNPNTALFKPIDHRLPRVMVPMDNCPKDFLQRPEDHANTLFICRVTSWRENSMYADGELLRSLGEAGEIEPETESILIETDVDHSEFTEEMLSSLPVHELPWQIPEEECTKRRDFRKECVFTIDPATARDLDDALSCEKLDDGTYNVGVHIADVSYFLEEETELDKRARFRATSVYLIQKVIPMLPRILCEELCSLNPNQDRLTFSVVWNMSETGEIYGEWFGRSVIRSCVKLSYAHAQGFIEDPDREWTEEELPTISGGYPSSQIRDTVLNLQNIAKNLRKDRFDEGALRLDQVKLSFTLDKDTGMPNGYSVYRQKDSNRLVEEFMLLANMAVAHKIKKHFPKEAFLRRHPPPQVKMVEDLVELCNNLGFPIEAKSAGTLQRSLWRYAGNDDLSAARMQVLVSMCSKPMQNAKYFCTGCIDDEEMFRHYALNVPLYTHFTSPIRRYADVMVHRMLGAALDYSDMTHMGKQRIQGIADNCNDRKTNSKRASELSSELYFAVFVKTAGPFEEEGMVMGVLDKAFDVFILKFGVIKRVYCDKLAIKNKLYYKEQKNPILTLYWEPAEGKTEGQTQKISIFTVVTCVLQPGDLPLQWMAIIKPPKE